MRQGMAVDLHELPQIESHKGRIAEFQVLVVKSSFSQRQI